MKLSVLQENFFSGLSLTSRFVSSRAQLPVLANIYLGAGKGKLRLAATNLEMGISLEVGAKVEKEGETTAPARLLFDLISNMPPGKIEVEGKEGLLLLSSKGFSGKITTIPASEFPSVPSSSSGPGTTLERDVLSEIVKKVAFAASTNDSRPVLTGVLLLFGEKLQAVATDGFRLSTKEFGVKKEKKEKESILLPAKALEEMERSLENPEEKIKISFLDKEGQATLVGNSVVLTSRLLEGEFPDFERIIPKKTTFTARMGREDLTRAVKAAAVFAKEAASVVQLKLEEGKVLVSAESQQYGEEKAEVDAKTEGGELETAFNYRYLLDFLGAGEAEEVFFGTEGASSPGLFKDGKDKSFLHLIMPVRIQS